MQTKTFLLSLLLVVGFSLPNCMPDCNCGPITGEFFDVKAMNVTHVSNNPGRQMEPEEIVAFEDYSGIKVEFEVDFVVSRTAPPNPWSFSLIPQALACDCAVDGWLGSKNERLDSMQVITLNDFDAEHPANSSINDLLTTLDIREFDIDPLDEIVANYPGNLQQQSMKLSLTKAPELNKELKVKVVVGLSTGEVYEQEVYVVGFE